MTKRCILHGNCQGETLAAMLSASPEFSARYEVEYVVNFTRAPVRPESLEAGGLFLHQHLGPQWGELSSRALRDRLPGGCEAVCFPNMFFTGYWPFWTNRAGFDFADGFLDSLLERGLSREECLHLAVKGDVSRFFDLEALLAKTLAQEREREAESDVAYVDHVEAHFRERKLFQTVNHPCRELMLGVADAVLGLLGLPGLPEAFTRVCPEIYGEFELPIHPGVARFHGLGFAGEDRLYNVFGRPMTYATYAACYIDCRLAGRGDFLDYLSE